MTITIDSTRSAAVNHGHFWISIDDQPPPAGVKVLLINRANGVACLSTYSARHQWTHWQGLPRFCDDEQQAAPPRMPARSVPPIGDDGHEDGHWL